MPSCFQSDQEPVIAVGLVDGTGSVTIRLWGLFTTDSGHSFGPGELQVQCRGGMLRCTGAADIEATALELAPDNFDACQFAIETTIGIDFHWEQKEVQLFRGGLRLVSQAENRLAVVNRVPLETYITSVICSEMSATSPLALIKSHAVISRSWLLAQFDARDAPHRPPPTPTAEGEIIGWTDREAHTDFDVCADDHCQRYQGVGRVDSHDVAAAIAETRGEVLTFEGMACDARYSKCCGGVVEEFQTAWGDKAVPYLVALPDGPGAGTPLPDLSDERTVRRFIEERPDAYCNCTDAAILSRVLNDYDQTTHDFFRWRVDLEAGRATELIANKLGVNLGRLLALEPVERGPSGRLKRLRLIGETGQPVIGKELVIRRALSPSHLYSSAFVIDIEGPKERPDAFVLTGAGWGHGVGLCQIGAAVMACQGIGYEEILRHYYPGAEIQAFYA